MFKLNALNPLTLNTIGLNWALQGFTGAQEAMQMVELLYNEGFEQVTFDAMTAQEVLDWNEVSEMAGLSTSSTSEEVWAVRLRNRPELISAPTEAECLALAGRS